MPGSTPLHAGNRLLVSRSGDAVVVQVVGLGNMLLAPTLQALVESERKAGCVTNFVIDLSRCDGMDSTFMGTFIGLSGKVKSVGADAEQGWFTLVNVSDANMHLLRGLGVLHLVAIQTGKYPVPEGQTVTLYPTTDAATRHKQILSAHKLLVKADPENEARFSAFIKAIETEMGEAESTQEDESASEDDGDDDGPLIVPPKHC